MNVNQSHQPPSGNVEPSDRHALAKANKQGFLDAQKALQGLIQMFQEEHDPKAKQLARKAEKLADTLSSASSDGGVTYEQLTEAQSLVIDASKLSPSKGSQMLMDAVGGLSSAAFISYTASMTAPQIAPPPDISMNQSLIDTINTPSMLPQMMSVLNLVQELERTIIQEEGQMQGKSYIEGTKLSNEAINARKAAGFASAAAQEAQSTAQRAQGLSQLVAGSTQALAFGMSFRTPSEVKDVGKPNEPGYQPGLETRAQTAQTIKTHDDDLLQLKENLPLSKSTGKPLTANEINDVLQQEKNSATIPKTHGYSTDEVEAMGNYKTAARQFATDHPDLVQEGIDGKSKAITGYDPNDAESTPEITKEGILSSQKQTEKEINGYQERISNAGQQWNHRWQTFGQIVTSFSQASSQMAESSATATSAQKKKEEAENEALQQAAQRQQEVMQMWQQAIDKGKNDAQQGSSALNQTLQGLIESSSRIRR